MENTERPIPTPLTMQQKAKYWTENRLRYIDALRCKSCTSIIKEGVYCAWCIKTYLLAEK